MQTFENLYSRRSIRSYTGEGPSEAQLAEIRQAGTLKAMPLGTVNAENSTVTVTMENNAVALLELHPEG